MGTYEGRQVAAKVIRIYSSGNDSYMDKVKRVGHGYSLICTPVGKLTPAPL